MTVCDVAVIVVILMTVTTLSISRATIAIKMQMEMIPLQLLVASDLPLILQKLKKGKRSNVWQQFGIKSIISITMQLNLIIENKERLFDDLNNC